MRDVESRLWEGKYKKKTESVSEGFWKSVKTRVDFITPRIPPTIFFLNFNKYRKSIDLQWNISPLILFSVFTAFFIFFFIFSLFFLDFLFFFIPLHPFIPSALHPRPSLGVSGSGVRQGDSLTRPKKKKERKKIRFFTKSINNQAKACASLKQVFFQKWKE